MEVLNILSINASTIGEVSFIDSIKIQDANMNEEPIERHDLHLYMLRNINLHRHNYREFSLQCTCLTKAKKGNPSTEDIFDMLSSEEENEDLHSMDIFMLLFFQCDVLYRQIFLENAAKCQTSLPLITMEPRSNKLMMYDFALRMIKKVCAIEGTVEEFRIVKKAMPIISFIRLKSAGKFSKSKMINQLLGINHNYFFHREIGGSSTKSYLLPGTIEIGWYLPKKKGQNVFDQCITFLNLRGNSLIFPKQMSFLQNVSDVIFIYVSLNRLEEEEWYFLQQVFSTHGSKLVLVLEERPKKQLCNDKYFTSLKIHKNNCMILKGNIYSNKVKLVESINARIQNIDATSSIESCTIIAKEIGINLESESLKELEVFPHIIEEIFNSYFEKISCQFNINALKKKLFKLQGKWWKDWSSCERYINKVESGYKGREFKIDIAKIDMKVSRANQVEHLCSMETSILSLLTMYITNDQDNMRYSLLFLRILMSFLEDRALEVLPKLYKEFKTIADILHQGNQGNSEDSVTTTTMKARLIELEDEITNSSVGEEHIMREFGQIFESITTVDKSYCDIMRDTRIFQQFCVRKLPIMAARFLLSGIPLEILDGDVSQVPITWIKSVFQEIGNIVGVNKKVYIVSILGIQSSGKSTLLNTMFGLQFPVSAGRCTKGAFMQLVPIDQSTSLTLGYDYLMIIDTEGLKGMEKRNSSSHLHDNELATFAVGLANLTVININGEDQSDMHDILQITIYALIRMKEVELNPKCIFIHQNIVSDSADDKLITQRNKLVDLLNEMTIAAANQEDLTLKYKQFSDVIGFTPKVDILYFSGLFQGEPPMAPTNLGYCRNAEEARKIILTKCQESSQFYNLHQVGKRTDEIWSCIIKEDFGFHYRNILELNITLELELELIQWQLVLAQGLIQWECQQLNIISNFSDQKLEVYWEELSLLLKDKCDTLYKKEQNNLIQKYFESHISRDIIKNKQDAIEGYFTTIRGKKYKDAYAKFERIYKVHYQNKDFGDLLEEVERKLLKEFNKIYQEYKKQAEQGQCNDVMIGKLFSEGWNDLSKDFPKETNKPIDIKQKLETFFNQIEIMRSVNLSDKKMLIGERKMYQQIDTATEFAAEKGRHWSKIRGGIEIFSKMEKIDNGIGYFLLTIQEECQAMIESKFTKESNFSENAFKWILDLVDNLINERNEENTRINKRERNYTLTKELKHDFAFFQCCKLVPQFEKIQETFLENNSFKREVVKKKEQFKTYFFSLWKGARNEQCAANELATLIFKSIADSASQLMERYMITVFKDHNNQFQTKYALQLNVMIELCEEENFASYILYILNPVQYIISRLRKQFNSFYAKEEMIRIILNDYNQNIVKKIRTTINAAREALEQVDKGINSEKHARSEITKELWRNKFLDLIKSDIGNITNAKLTIFDAYDILNFDEFIQALSNLLSQKEKENDVKLPENHREYCDEILKDVIQCRVCCPYCNELCQLNLAPHEHYCGEFHRPLGLTGIKNASNEHISRTCPSLVKRKGMFQLKKSKFANMDFSESRLKAENWRINEKEILDTHYWMWVMDRFQFQFESYFDASLNCKKPSSLTKNEILTELSGKLDSFGNDTILPTTPPIVPMRKIPLKLRKIFSSP